MVDLCQVGLVKKTEKGSKNKIHVFKFQLPKTVCNEEALGANRLSHIHISTFLQMVFQEREKSFKSVV